MHNSLKAFITILLLFGVLNFPAFAAGNGITVSKVWARATPGTVKTGAIYLTVTNSGKVPDHLVRASSPVANQTQLHRMIMKNNVMEMRPVASLEIAPGKSVVLAPGGYHVMLIGLKAPLKEGQTVPLSLTFEKGGTVEVTARVEKVGAMGPSDRSGSSSMPGMSGGSGPMNMPSSH